MGDAVFILWLFLCKIKVLREIINNENVVASLHVYSMVKTRKNKIVYNSLTETRKWLLSKNWMWIFLKNPQASSENVALKLFLKCG